LLSHDEREKCLKTSLKRKTNATPIFVEHEKDPEKYSPISPTSIPEKVMQQLILQTISSS